MANSNKSKSKIMKNREAVKAKWPMLCEKIKAYGYSPAHTPTMLYTTLQYVNRTTYGKQSKAFIIEKLDDMEKTDSLAPVKAAEVKPIKARKRADKKAEYEKSMSFLKSTEWRIIRYKALLANGKKCQCCGAAPPDVVLNVDHIKPRSKYPELALDINNLQVLCSSCNHGKLNWDETDHR